MPLLSIRVMRRFDLPVGQLLKVLQGALLPPIPYSCCWKLAWPSSKVRTVGNFMRSWLPLRSQSNVNGLCTCGVTARVLLRVCVGSAVVRRTFAPIASMLTCGLLLLSNSRCWRSRATSSMFRPIALLMMPRFPPGFGFITNLLIGEQCLPPDAAFQVLAGLSGPP